ncbi:hypothetical protein J8J04_02505 ['Fragaria x ananassa' phyllody phytoplasma]|uniref:Uncharacterized protein n=1 Tax='Fragaria x ananassa' phyllody phytoplasma TaxID=2358428 RepID=A0ABS5K3Q4_9MOLU|nr:hypothetical protein ['Fragaria x ananassa' phyllody phytoplasma]MBS2126547.1 hypothetical protein ['Fragaria x ananassa' phyllody phytoplasma]
MELPDSLDLYTAIRDWKRENNLFDYGGEYKEEKREQYTCYEDYLRGGKPVPATNEKFIVQQITNFFETKDKIYTFSLKNKSFNYCNLLFSSYLL